MSSLSLLPLGRKGKDPTQTCFKVITGISPESACLAVHSLDRVLVTLELDLGCELPVIANVFSYNILLYYILYIYSCYHIITWCIGITVCMSTLSLWYLSIFS